MLILSTAKQTYDYIHFLGKEMVGVAGFEPTAPTSPVLRAATGDALRTGGKLFIRTSLQIEYHTWNQEVK